jgi:hypothetical protein
MEWRHGALIQLYAVMDRDISRRVRTTSPTLIAVPATNEKARSTRVMLNVGH